MNEQNIENSPSKKSIATRLIIGFILLFLAIGIASMAVDAAQEREFEYQPKTPAAQILYDQVVYKKCLAEKELAQAKLEDVTNEVEMDIDLNEMKRKRDMECDRNAIEIMEEKEYTPNARSEVEEKSHIDKLAYAVAMAETKDCTLGYGKEYLNCFGIKNGSISPCERIGRNRMCIYNNKEEAYTAFKRIWTRGYSGRYPTYKDAAVYTGNDRPDNWLRIVNQYYYS